MLIQVLIIHGQLAFAIALKQGLERSAPFEAHPFRSVDAAFDYLREHVQDVALVDFSLTEMSGEDIIRRLREIQPTINVVVTPPPPDNVYEALGLQGSLSAKFTVRELAPLLRDLFRDRERPSDAPSKPGLLNRLSSPPIEPPKPTIKPLSSRAAQPPISPPVTPPPAPPALPEMTSLDNILLNMGDIFEQESSETPIPTDDDDSASVWDDGGQPDLFDEVLNALPREVQDRRKPVSDPFEDLVNSMRTGQPHQPLPARRSEYVEFVFKGGLDVLFDQIDRATTANKPLDLPSTSLTFEKLAREEPPPPPFEESGTVGDLISGVGDQSFRDVLSMLSDKPLANDKPLPRVHPEPYFSEQAHLVPKVPSEIFNFDDDESSESSPAKAILSQVLEQSRSPEGFSLEDLLANIERQLPKHRPRVQPLPSWVKESQSRGDERFLTTEPDFLPESDEGFESQFVEQVTIPSKGQPVEPLPDETLWLDSPGVERGDTLMTTPPDAALYDFPEVETPDDVPVSVPEMAWDQPVFEPTLPPDELADDTEDEAKGFTKPYPSEMLPVSARPPAPPPPADLPEFPPLATEQFNTAFELLAAFEVVEDKALDDDRYDFTLGRAPVASTPAADDPRIAQLALSLTDASLELTADASLLTRGGQIVAYAGSMAEDEILGIQPFIPADADSLPSGSNIRFVSAQDSPKNYMLYSAVTDDDLILSLIFASSTSLRDIRKQGQRLAEALRTVPELPLPPIEMPPALFDPLDNGVRALYAFVWLTESASMPLPASVAQAIRTGLHMQLGEGGWLINALHVDEDYVYLLADVPGDTPPFELIRDLKRRSAELARSQKPDLDADLLWSDGYLVVTPGRALEVDEIQQFISFERMG